MYNETITMPSNFSVIADNEMTYIDGGTYYSKITTLADAKQFLGAILGLNWIGGAASAIGTAVFAGFAITDIYFGYNIWRAQDAYNDVCKWQGLYGSNRACRVGANMVLWDKICLGVDAELLNWYY
jgi:hypothetical protein